MSLFLLNWLKRVKKKKIKVVKRNKKQKTGGKVSITDHDSIISHTNSDTLIAYTDGSASPNPGPSGGGACIFLQNPDSIIDCGATLGVGTNNSAELYALGACFAQIIKLHAAHPHIQRAIIFSDSKLAIGAAVGSRRPLTNITLVNELRKLYNAMLFTKLAVDLRWIPGHAGVGGNERVDRISKRFAIGDFKFNENSILGFPCSVCTRGWPFFPLINALRKSS